MKKVLRTQPGNFELLKSTGVLFYHAGDKKEALKHLLKADSKTVHAEVAEIIGNIYNESGKLDTYIDYAGSFCDRTNRDPVALRLLIKALMAGRCQTIIVAMRIMH